MASRFGMIDEPGSWECKKCMIKNDKTASRCKACSTPKPNTGIGQPPPPFGALSFGSLEPSSDSWDCKKCMVRNDKTTSKCIACSAPKTATGTGQLSSAFGGFSFGAAKPSPDLWDCKTCKVRNGQTASKCAACSAPKPDTGTGQPSSSFGAFPFGRPKPSPDSWDCKACQMKNSPDSSKCSLCESCKPESDIKSNTVRKAAADGASESSKGSVADSLSLPDGGDTKTSLSSERSASSQRKPTTDGLLFGACKPAFNFGGGVPDERKAEHKPTFGPRAGKTSGASLAETSNPNMSQFTFGKPIPSTGKEHQGATDENEDFSCHICYDDFDTPKVISCGHTFCMKCIESVVDRAGTPQTLQCPTCRKDVAFPESGKTEDLATNFQLLSLINHKKGKKKEPVIKGKQSKCNIHGQENKLYCQDCEGPICFNCTLREHEVGKHTIITKKEFVEEKRREVYKLAIKLPDARQTFNQMREDFEQRREEYNQKKENLKSAVQAALDEKRKQLDDHANQLLKEIDQSLIEPDDKNEDFADQLIGRGGVLEVAERSTKTLLEALDRRNFVDASEITGISGDLTTITDDFQKLRVNLQALPFEIPLCFEPNTHDSALTVGELLS